MTLEQMLIDFFVKKICENTYLVFSLKTTYFTFRLQRDIEFESLMQYQKEVEQVLKDRFPFCWNASLYSYTTKTYGPLFSIFNDVNCKISAQLESFGNDHSAHWPPYTKYFAEGWSSLISYSIVTEELKISENLVKDGILELIRKGKIVRKRVDGGFIYFVREKSLVYALECVMEDGFQLNFCEWSNRCINFLDNDDLVVASLDRHIDEINEFFYTELHGFIHNIKCEMNKKGVLCQD